MGGGTDDRVVGGTHGLEAGGGTDPLVPGRADGFTGMGTSEFTTFVKVEACPDDIAARGRVYI